MSADAVVSPSRAGAAKVVLATLAAAQFLMEEVTEPRAVAFGIRNLFAPGPGLIRRDETAVDVAGAGLA